MQQPEQQIWTLSDYTGEFLTRSYAMADGYNTWFNGYDNQSMSWARTQRHHSTAPMTAITSGTIVVIHGTVTDISAAQRKLSRKQTFQMEYLLHLTLDDAWMGYVYQQQPKPTSFTGVAVTLTAVDPNHNFITIGEVTTDSAGAFSYLWTPPTVPGQYTVTATFCGTNGYYGSSAETAMAVQNAPPTPAPNRFTTNRLGIDIDRRVRNRSGHNCDNRNRRCTSIVADEKTAIS